MTNQWKIIRSIGAGVASISLLAGCGTASKVASPTAISNVPHTLVVDLDAAPSNLDPGLQYNLESYWVYRNMFDQLLTDNPKTNAIEPDVATSWKNVSPTQWTFTIRTGIKFTNGQPLTAQDVAYSLDRIISPSFDSPQAPNFSEVKSVAASGNQVTITTTQPDPVLLGNLTTLSIVPKNYIVAHGNAYFNLHPIGSGPYELQQWVQGSTVTLVRNPHYWGKEPIFPSVEFRAVPSEATRVSDLQSGVADIAFPIQPDQASVLQSSSTLQLLATPTDRVAYLAFNTDQAPTNNLLVREAITHALDIPLMIKTIEQGYGHQVNTTLTPIGFGYDASIPNYTYNPGLAKTLLKEANYTGTPMVFATSPSYPTIVIQAIQQELSAVGIPVKIVSTTQATYLQKIQSPTHSWGNLRMGAWQGTWPDASTYLYPMFYSSSIWSSWANPQFDVAIVAAQSTLNKSTRQASIDRALQILHAQAPAMGLWQEFDLYGANKNLAWQPNPLENFFVAQMGWK